MSLVSTNKAEEANLYTIDISIDAEVFADAQAKAWNKIKGKINHPGFRKGKMPRNMAEKLYGKGFLYEDALDICYPAAAQAAIEESGLDMVGTGKVDVTEIGEDGVKVSLEVYVRPVAEIKDYKGLEAEVEKFEVTDAEVDAKIDELVERNARIITVEDRASEMGDIATIDFEGFVDGVAFEGGKGEDYDLVLGSGSFIPGFEEQVCGKNVGESFDVNVTFPEEYGAEELAGKEAVFNCALKKLQHKELPEVDDEFAQDAADFDTLDELKASLKEEITESKKSKQQSDARATLLEKLANIVEVEVPACMVDDEVESQVRDMDYNFKQQGFGIELYLQYMGITVDDYKEQIRENAEKNVKVRLALEAIAAAESIEISQEEIDAEYAKFAETYKMEVEQVKAAVSEKMLVADMRVNKAADFVYDAATITEVEPSDEVVPEIDVDLGEDEADE